MDAATVWACWGEQIRRYVEPIAGSVSVGEPGGFMALSGMPVPDFNHVGIRDPRTASTLTEQFTAHLVETDTQAIVMVAPEAGTHASGPAAAGGRPGGGGGAGRGGGAGGTLPAPQWRPSTPETSDSSPMP